MKSFRLTWRRNKGEEEVKYFHEEVDSAGNQRSSQEDFTKKGWIKSERKHDTGIGQTLEHHLGMTENNISLPDFGKMELKSQRIKHRQC